jgi:hypothetical protein
MILQSNKRNHVRIVVTLRVMADCSLGKARGTTKNLSVGGMYMLTDAKFPAGTELTLTLDHKMAQVEVRATVTHVREDGLGLKFIDPPEATVSELIFIIDDILSTGADIDGGETMLDGNEHLVLVRRGVLESVATLIGAGERDVTIEADEIPEVGEAVVVLVPARSDGLHVREIIGTTATVSTVDARTFTAALKDPGEEFMEAARRVLA